ncbi:extracellular solute-binding protein [Paenibacillus sp. J5C_2022]|uniref:extracellular solute-binding protein n=1 Tax=Paenibacillus sp. J5C2022 TaxID=2977129 RepID=UPI0021D17E8E|nr:extracellular solute-binding protein [Paenibacillus sp. J5C2022]MCU6710527.1 extracellular solute-binding protein [Paenibacillus sp. J5C2022]
MTTSSKTIKAVLLSIVAFSLMLALAGCGNDSSQEAGKVVISTNADEEAVAAMEAALKSAGYEGKFVIQSLGTSELGGKLLAEGSDIEADLVTMSSYFIESAQAEHAMFKDLTFQSKALDSYPSYYAPILGNTGSIFVNTEVLKEKGLPMPTSIKDLTRPEYKDLVSIPNIMHSSTAWLLVQAIISEYGDEAGTVMHDLIVNAGPHLESSGSGPIKKVEAGEVAAGFGLRHQAVRANADGAPIDFVDPVEGNFSLTESIAVVDKDNATTELAMKMAQTIIEQARGELITNYPVALYEGEKVDDVNKPAYAKVFAKPLTVELLEKHQKAFNDAK